LHDAGKGGSELLADPRSPIRLGDLIELLYARPVLVISSLNWQGLMSAAHDLPRDSAFADSSAGRLSLPNCCGAKTTLMAFGVISLPL
jgi:hypothetical protein